MSDSTKKTTKKTNRSTASSSSKRSSASAKNKKTTTSSGAAGRKQAGSSSAAPKRSTGSSRVNELERRGYISRNAPEVRTRGERQRDPNSEAKKDDIIIIVVTLICVLMFLSYLGICGIVGTGINAFVFGLFGRLGYILPFIVWVLTIFFIANKDNGVSPLGALYAVLLSSVLGALIQLAVGGYNEEIGLLDYFGNSSLNYEGDAATYGGLLGGVFVKLLCPFVGKVAAVLILIALLLILFVLMTGKTFIMAVFRKIEKRISAFRRRRAIEKSEQDFYDDAEDIDSDDEPGTRHTTTMRYGVRHIPGRRMGTREVSFGKRKDREESPKQEEQTYKADSSRKKNRDSYRTEKEEKKEQSTQNKTENIFIPGVGSVRLGKGSNLEVHEEEFTEKDFEETYAEASDESRIHLKKETSRKSDTFEEDSKITNVGVKTLHSGSIRRSVDGDASKIIGIHSSRDAGKDIPDAEETVHGSGTYEDAAKGKGYTETKEENGSEQQARRSRDNTDDSIITDIGRQNRDSSEQDSNIISISRANGYSGDDEIAKSVNEILNEDKKGHVYNERSTSDDSEGKAAFGSDETKRMSDGNHKTNLDVSGTDDTGRNSYGDRSVYNREAEPDKEDRQPREESSEELKTADAAKAGEQYANVTRIGSGAASFSDESKVAQMMNAEPDMQEYKFPPISLLKKGKVQQKDNGSKREELENTIQKLQSTFESFGVGVKVTDASVGPTVTRYELLPDQGVKVKTITALSDDIKLALAAAEIRIEAPIPGKAAVGIEVPNKESAPVLFGDLIDSDEFRKSKTNLAFAVGKDISGENIVSDIGDMPHALIAGATGSGKSVCINALIMSILYKAKPSEVKLIMVDPKRVELVGYNGIPHLIVPVVTDVKKAAGALAWAVAEMDDRYKRFADAGVRDLKGYNKLMQNNYIEEGNKGDSPEKLPQIVIIVDELNDLMMTANSKEVEADISRLTQLARACGIHVILATQRPSVNVITGTIKANIPTRIAFAVSSIVDSRTILDQAGAEKLLGKGDMLFYPRGYNKPIRLQGVYVSDEEVNNVVDFIKQQYKEMKYNELVSSHIEANASGSKESKEEGPQASDANANDPLFVECGKYIIEKQKSSVGALQRVFKIGFNRAARIMDQLAEAGVVSTEDGTKARTILMCKEEFEEYIGSTND